jgi:uncharacterized membrane protein
MWFAPYLDPKRGNLLQSKRFYSVIIELMAAMMTVIFFGQLWASYNHALPMASIIMALTGLMFIVLGNYIGRVKRNWTMGMRYSWTLSDDVVWTKTNRLAGWLFMGAGALVVIGSFLGPYVGLVMLIVPMFVILPATYVYSMRLYRQRQPDEMEPPTPVTPAEEEAAFEHAPIHPPQASGPHIDVACPSCGAENAPGNERCIVCGKPLG